jgi:peptidoglycan hydrolase-like protein with peptidoglycan-binding domain
MKRSALIFGLVFAALALVASPANARGKPVVAALQVGLQAKGFYRAGTIDGLWGPQTEQAVRRLQRATRLPADGRPGPLTRRALGRHGRPGYGSRILRAGHVGWDVSQVQFLLAWHGFPSGAFDGAFGPRTETAVRRFQAFARLAVDGVTGPATLAALRRRPLPRSPIRLGLPVRTQPTDRFGPRGNRFHTGVDFPASAGVRIRAAARGRVVQAGWDAGGYGNLVIVRHRLGTQTWYAHLGRVRVARGARVTTRTRLGTVGSTGTATGPHLHFEVRVRGAAVNPLPAFR